MDGSAAHRRATSCRYRRRARAHARRSGPAARRSPSANGDVAPAGRGARGAGGQFATGTRRRRRDRETSLDARGRRGDPGGHRACSRERTKRRHRRRHAVLGGNDPKGDREPPPRYRRVGGSGRLFGGAPLGPGGGRAGDSARDGVRLSARPRPQVAFDRLSRRRGHARPELLRSPRLGGAAGELHGDRQGRRSGPPLVPPRPCCHARLARRGADLLVGVDVRISDAIARHAGAGGQPRRRDEPADRAASDRLRGQARGALGRFGIRLQRPRPGVHLPVFELRRARPWAEARARRERRRCPLRDRAREHGRSAGCSAQLRPPRRGRCERPLWLLRGPGLHAESACRKARPSRSCGPLWRTIRA